MTICKDFNLEYYIRKKDYKWPGCSYIFEAPFYKKYLSNNINNK